MKVGILHLSDIHATDDFDSKYYSDLISKSLFPLSLDRITICISGDLTWSGKASQYNLIDDLINSIKNNAMSHGISYGKTVFVPGNHDMAYGKEEKRTRSVLLNMSQQQYIDGFDDEIKRFEDYYSFSECYEIPDLRNTKGKSMPRIEEKIDGLTIRYYLLNNSLYTTYLDPSHDDSKGTVMVPKEVFNDINGEADTVNILLMHFPPSYLDSDTFKKLKLKMPCLSFVLAGHVHDKTDLSFSQQNMPCAVSIGNALSSNNPAPVTYGYSLLVLDSKEKTITQIPYSIVDDHALRGQENRFSIRLSHLNNPLVRKQDFVDFLEEQESCDTELSKTFVFPELGSRNEETLSQQIKISSFDELETLSRKGSPIFVCGPSKSGKTALLKSLHFSFDQIGISVLLEWSTIKSCDEIDYVLKHRLEKEYADSFAYDVFYSISKDQRVALVDGAVLDEDIETVLSKIQTIFGRVILTFKDSRYNSKKQLLSRILSQSQATNKPVLLTIKPMFFTKRKQLIEKCYSALAVDRHKPATPDAVESFFNNVQSALDRFVGTDSNYPYFIEMTTSSFFGQKISGGASSRGLYNEIYRIHITSLIEKAFNNNEQILIALKTLPLLANSIFEKDVFSIKHVDAMGIIDKFKQEKRIKGDLFSSNKIINSLIDAKVLCEVEDNIAFASVDFLAYFAAQYASEILESNFEKNVGIIDKSLDLCYVDVHVRFLLFLAFFSKKKVYEYLIIKSKEYCKNHGSKDVVEMEFAKRNKESGTIRPLTRKEKKDVDSKRHEGESRQFDKKEAEYQKEVEEGVKEADDFEKEIMKGYGLITLVSSLIPDFKTEIDADEQDVCIDLLYKLPEIVTTLENHFLNEDFDGFIQGLIELFNAKSLFPKKELLEEIIVDIYRAKMLSLFESTMNSAHTRLTEDDLRDRKHVTNGTCKLLRLMSMVFDSNPEETFEKIAPEYFKAFTYSPFARNCISLIVRFYATWIIPSSKLLDKKDFLLVFFNEKAVNETIKSLILTDREK